MKAKIVIIHQMDDRVFDMLMWVQWVKVKDMLFGKLYINISLNISGRLAVTVYKIKYILACKRSGWYPQPRINKVVGIREASKKM